MENALKYITERIEELEKAMDETEDLHFKRTYEDLIESFETVQVELEACVGEQPPSATQANKLLPLVSQQRELLINFMTMYDGDENSQLHPDIINIIDTYLKIN